MLRYTSLYAKCLSLEPVRSYSGQSSNVFSNAFITKKKKKKEQITLRIIHFEKLYNTFLLSRVYLACGENGKKRKITYISTAVR